MHTMWATLGFVPCNGDFAILQKAKKHGKTQNAGKKNGSDLSEKHAICWLSNQKPKSQNLEAVPLCTMCKLILKPANQSRNLCVKNLVFSKMLCPEF